MNDKTNIFKEFHELINFNPKFMKTDQLFYIDDIFKELMTIKENNIDGSEKHSILNNFEKITISFGATPKDIKDFIKRNGFM